MSGWTGFAPLSLAEKTGIFKKNGADVTIKFIPQKDRHLAIASGDVQCAATTVETWIVWNANGVATRQVVQLAKSYGADGMVVRNNIATITDLKGKTVAASSPGTAPYFTLAWMLKKNGLSVKDVTIKEVFANGQLAAKDGKYLLPVPKINWPAWATDTIHVGRKLTAKDFEILAPVGKTTVTAAIQAPFYTDAEQKQNPRADLRW